MSSLQCLTNLVGEQKRGEVLKATICSFISAKYFDFLLKHIFQCVEMCPVLNLGIQYCSYNHSLMKQIIRFRKMSTGFQEGKAKSESVSNLAL